MRRIINARLSKFGSLANVAGGSNFPRCQDCRVRTRTLRSRSTPHTVLLRLRLYEPGAERRRLLQYKLNRLGPILRGQNVGEAA